MRYTLTTSAHPIQSKAMNVIFIAGLKDVPRYEVNRIFNDIILLKKNVKQQNPKNLFLMAGMLCPPKYVWYKHNGLEPTLPYGRVGMVCVLI